MAEPSIERRLVDGEWRTVEREEGDGGGLPDGGSTGEVLTKASGADQDVEWAPGAGSLPDDAGQPLGAVLQLIASAVASILSPTAADLDTDARQAPLLVEGWTQWTNYMQLRKNEGGTGTFDDIVQFLHPVGNDNVFLAEAGNWRTDGVEPDWSAAPNVGDSVPDGDGGAAWYNVGLYSAWPFAPATWQPGAPYAAGALVWPTVPNGHLYVAFPPGPLTSDVTEPVWTTNGDYVADNDGYWWDAGQAVELAAGWSPAALLRQLVLSTPAGSNPTALSIHQGDLGSNAVDLFNDTFSRTLPMLSAAVLDDGSILVNADTPFAIQLDPWIGMIATGTRDPINPADYPDAILTLDFSRGGSNVPVLMVGLPASDPLIEGQLWDDGGVLSISHPPP